MRGWAVHEINDIVQEWDLLRSIDNVTGRAFAKTPFVVCLANISCDCVKLSRVRVPIRRESIEWITSGLEGCRGLVDCCPARPRHRLYNIGKQGVFNLCLILSVTVDVPISSGDTKM